jgi:hypothetical protein
MAQHRQPSRHPDPLECAEHSGKNPRLENSTLGSACPHKLTWVQREDSLHSYETQGLLIFQSWDLQGLWDKHISYRIQTA